jgi:hypothetical protein
MFATPLTGPRPTLQEHRDGLDALRNIKDDDEESAHGRVIMTSS